MIIAPLMSPIIGLSFGLAVLDKRMITLSLVTVVAGTLLIDPLKEEFRRIFVKHRVARLIVELSEAKPGLVSGRSEISSIDVVYRDDLLHVYAMYV